MYVPDPIAPPVANRPAEAVELVCLAVSDGDLEAALAQYEAGAPLRPWAHYPDEVADQIAEVLLGLIHLRLPLSIRICAIVAADGVALVLGERRIAGLSPDRQWIQLSGSGATVVRCQRDGSWRIAADAWNLGSPNASHAGAEPHRTCAGQPAVFPVSAGRSSSAPLRRSGAAVPSQFIGPA